MADLKDARRELGYGSGDEATIVHIPRPGAFSARDWIERDLPPLDPLLDDLFTTTTRAELIGSTGIGKSNLAFAMGFAISTGAPFLHWQARRAAKRLIYLDGEMSARVARARIKEAAERHGSAPDNLVLINRDDFQAMPPLNTEDGQRFVDGLIEQAGGVEFIILDNVQSLLVGDMKEGIAWSETLPWVRSLTRRAIGQLWVHHTGIDRSRGYGDSTKEWQLDTVMLMADRQDKGELLIDFDLSFLKARERDRHNRACFSDARIWINSDNRWESSTVPAAQKQRKPKTMKPETAKALEYLRDVMVDQAEQPNLSTMPPGCKAVKVDAWREHLKIRGLHEGGEAGKKWFQRVRNDLTAANLIASSSPYVWLVTK